MSTTIAITDSAFTRSPYNWASVTLSGAVPAIRAVNSGAFIDFSFTGTSCILDIDTGSFDSGQSLNLMSYVDGTPSVVGVSQGDTSKTLATGLSDTTHTLKLFLNYAVVSDGNLWPAHSSLTIKSVTLDTGKTITASNESTLPCALGFGDSTMMGYTGSSVIAYASFGIDLCALLNRRAGMCAFSGQTWNQTQFGGLPGLVDAWDFIYSGQARTFTPTPSVVINNMGYNGTVVAATVEGWLADVRSVLPTVPIFQILPFNQTAPAANIVQINLGYANYLAANPSETRMHVIDLGSAGATIIANPTYSEDGIHPNEAGCAALAALAAPLILPYFGSITAASVNFGALTVG